MFYIESLSKLFSVSESFSSDKFYSPSYFNFCAPSGSRDYYFFVYFLIF